MIRPLWLSVPLSLLACSSTADSAVSVSPAPEAAAPRLPSSSDTDASTTPPDAQRATLVESGTPCALTGVHSVDVPAVHASAHATLLRHRYRLFAAAQPSGTTVVVVPGGPGGHIMGKSPGDDYALGAIPNDAFDVIYTDARGSGCNSYPALVEAREDVYSIEEVARDVAAVVRAQKLTDYILYGASFGTTAATVAATILEHDGGPPPKAVVLEGTMGRAFDSFDSYFAAFQNEWTRVKSLVSPAWRTEFEKEPWSPALYWSREQWGLFVSQQLIIGDIPGSGHSLNYWLAGLSAKSSRAQSYVGNFMAAAASGAPAGELFATIACRELWGSWRVAREIRDGKLEAPGPDICGGAPKAAPYDSAKYALNATLVYFQGPFDPTTTMAQAEYHFESQSAARARHLVRVPAAAHAPLTLGLKGRGCAKALWSALDKAPQSLAQLLATCTQGGAAPASVTSSP
ncbi:MAG: alpha/beta fold hydrolase [Myxococcales bacterium]|nr:alpha/beta fold hydrolase [Myxococcales bacterium]